MAPPKPIGLTINYLRSGRALDSYARVSIVKQGRRVVAFEAQAWQDDPAKPIASAFGHFMLRKTPGADEEYGWRLGRCARVAAAPTKNIENNPMQSSRRPPQPTVWTENLTRRANQRHNFIIPEFAKRLRARNIDAIMFRVAGPLRTRRRRLREGAETAKIRLVQNLSGESHTDAV